jgi:hypothetical protein
MGQKCNLAKLKQCDEFDQDLIIKKKHTIDTFKFGGN